MKKIWKGFWVGVCFTGGLIAFSLVYGTNEDSNGTGHFKPTWGYEFTFTNQALIDEANKGDVNTIDSSASMEARDLWAEKIAKNCNDRQTDDPDKCFVFQEVDKYGSVSYKVQYSDGLHYSITLDPYVIEVIGSPLTLEDAKVYQERFQRDLFDIARSVVVKAENRAADKGNLYPHRRIGNGHMHVGLKAFKKMDDEGNISDDSVLFLNFLTDYFNHPTLSMGSMGVIPNNAPTLGILSEEQRKEYQAIIDEFRAAGQKWSILEIAREIESRVYTKTYSQIPAFKKFPRKYQAVNLRRVTSGKFPDDQVTIEIRGNRPQRSMDDFVSMMALYQARIEKLKGQTEVNNYADNYLPNRFRKVVNPGRVVGEFYDYVVSAGLDWDDYKKLLSVEFTEANARAKVELDENSAYQLSLQYGQDQNIIIEKKLLEDLRAGKDGGAILQQLESLDPSSIKKLDVQEEILSHPTFAKKVFDLGLGGFFVPENQDHIFRQVASEAIKGRDASSSVYLIKKIEENAGMDGALISQALKEILIKESESNAESLGRIISMGKMLSNADLEEVVAHQLAEEDNLVTFVQNIASMEDSLGLFTPEFRQQLVANSVKMIKTKYSFPRDLQKFIQGLKEGVDENLYTGKDILPFLMEMGAFKYLEDKHDVEIVLKLLDGDSLRAFVNRYLESSSSEDNYLRRLRNVKRTIQDNAEQMPLLGALEDFHLIPQGFHFTQTQLNKINYYNEVFIEPHRSNCIKTFFRDLFDH